MTQTNEHAVAGDEVRLAPLIIGESIADTRTAEIYAARYPGSGTDLALKIARRKPLARAILAREADITPTIDSAYVFPVISSGVIRQPGTRWNGLPYLVTPFNEEGTLVNHEVTDAASARGTLGIIKDVARGLRDMHAQGYVHCDVKAGNIFLTNGSGFIADLGLAIPEGRRLGPDSHGLERGQTLGSFGFMPPEQMTGTSLTAAADVFSLGMTAVCVLAGEHPFGPLRATDGVAISMREMLAKVMHDRPKQVLPPYVPAASRSLLYNCLAPAPMNRPEMDELAELTLPE